MSFTAEWFVIVNRASGISRSMRDWTQIETLLHKAHLTIEVAFTEYKYHAVELSVHAINRGARKIIVVGGDATLHEVVNGLFIQKTVSPDAVTIGIIPAASIYRRSSMSAIPSSYPEAVQTIASGYFSMYNVISASYCKANHLQLRHIITSARIGMDANIVCRMVKLREDGCYGKLRQWSAAIRTMLNYHNHQIEIGVDGHKTTIHTFTSGIVNITGSNYNGGLIELRTIGMNNKLPLLAYIHKLRSGKLYDTLMANRHTGRSIVINSDSTIALSADGEMLGYSPIEFSLSDKSVRIIVPAHMAAFTPDGISILR